MVFWFFTRKDEEDDCGSSFVIIVVPKPLFPDTTEKRDVTWLDKEKSKKDSGKKKYPLCSHCKKLGHPKKFCWLRPNAQ
ncbi:hypothetical protein EPI10_021656 [Gossypium australe]|uniref:Uncharacterized protein n=1 Tax=Gossypium australe TaxID=47621 RepID=A0A5B6WKC4_9ROSI|nr:hypothetical protein EPI10_021656 [Gossypium australe]